MAENKNETLAKALHGGSFWHMAIGVIMVIAGILIILNPSASLLVIALYLGILLLATGFGYIIAAFAHTSSWYIFAGIINVLVGMILVANLGITAATLPIILALWAMFVGAVQLANAYQLSQMGFNGTWSLIYGILGIFFGFLILAYPAVGAVTLSMLLGVYIIIYGVLSISEYSFTRMLK